MRMQSFIDYQITHWRDKGDGGVGGQAAYGLYRSLARP